MTAPLEIIGDLWLYCQEGGYADDAFVLKDLSKEPAFVEQLLNAVSNEHIGFNSFDDLVADHFGVKRDMPSGNRHIGLVKIKIERLDE